MNFSKILSVAFLTVVLTSCSSNKLTVEDVEQEVKDPVDENNTDCKLGKVYIEKEGLLRVDIVNTDPSNNWSTENTLTGFEGTGYLVYTGPDSFSNPGNDVLNFPIKITQPGVYQFVWSSRISKGDHRGEHNDSWLKIDADEFYGEHATTKVKVYPKGSGKTPNPAGTSKNGWLKSYMNKLGEWLWKSQTNDHDPYGIFAKFNNAGVYNVQISGRSNGHAIDQFVLFRVDKNLNTAKQAELSKTECK
ncbi:hypothetical protein [Wenyingzhuangia sp. IMCC45574]